MPLNEESYQDNELSDMYGPLKPNVMGVYNHELFTLRLNKDTHYALKSNILGENRDALSTEDIVRAGSTLLHENLHWWQFVGSTSGLVMGLSLPAQIICNKEFFKDFIDEIGAKKPIRTYASNGDFKNVDDELEIINKLLFDYYDSYFYKALIRRPGFHRSISKEVGFQSVGASFIKTYTFHLLLLNTTFESKLDCIPDSLEFISAFDNLHTDKADGFYKDQADFQLPSIGSTELYEGQARFNQMLYMNTFSKDDYDFKYFKNNKMLMGDYYSAFERFLDVLGEQKPESVDSPLVALYLLLIDIAINPAEAFIFKIEPPEDFIKKTHPSIRFESLCNIVKDKFENFKTTIVNYSAEEYWYISSELCKELNYYSPKESLIKVSEWCENQEEIIDLLEENERFDFKDGNMPVRLIFARFLSFQKDKLKNPEVFCWPGVYMHGSRNKIIANQLFDKHTALFTENDDGEISATKLLDVDNETLSKTAGHFYAWIIMFEIAKQWISESGGFRCDAGFLYLKDRKEEIEKSVIKHFYDTFGVSPRDFEEVKPN